MPKGLCVLGMIVAALIVLLFVLDLVSGFPFSGASRVADAAFIAFAAILGYLSWSTYAEQV
jgi:uncharacterized membrane protein YjjP (DUF1212 family)